MRVIAWMILIVPGVIAVIGIKFMRDTFFGIPDALPYLWLQFLVGLLAFCFGIVFIGGFIFNHQRKRNERKKLRKNNNKA